MKKQDPYGLYNLDSSLQQKIRPEYFLRSGKTYSLGLITLLVNVYKRYVLKLFLFFIPFTFLTACTSTKVFTRTQLLMGHVPVTVSIKGQHKQQEVIYQAMQSAYNLARRLEAQLSEYQAQSEISCLNQKAGKSFCYVSNASVFLITLGETLRINSNGAFDIRYASKKLPLTNQPWFQQDKHHDKMMVLYPDIKIGLSSLSKGFIVDAMMQQTLLQNFNDVMIVAGGDSLAKGGPWQISFQIPYAKLGKKSYPLTISNRAIGTSGSYEQGGHIKDPRTHQEIVRPTSVSVLGKDLTLANALATTLFVLGPEVGNVLLSQYPNYHAIWMNEHGQIHNDSLGTDQ